VKQEADFTDEQLLLTTVQAGRVLGVGRTTIYQLIKTGELHAVHVGGSCRISWAELERYVTRLDSAGNQPADPHVSATGRSWRRVVDADGQRTIFAVGIPDPHGPAA
jgi:excisionase family DNA binding protein